MLSLTFKPFRKPSHLLGVTDEEIHWKLKGRAISRKVAAGCSAEETKHRLYTGTRHRKQPLKMVNDAVGRIENILLTIPPFFDQKNPTVVIDPLDERHIKTLIGHLSRQKRHYTIVCHGSMIKRISTWFREYKIPKADYTLCLSIFNYSVWAQDAYVALSDERGKPVLCEGVCFTRDQDMTVADDLSIQTEISSLQSHLYFEGGNILQIGDHVLIGKDYLIENTGRMYLDSMDAVIQHFSQLLQYPVISVGRKEIIPGAHREHLGGGIYQPIFHIDMYISPTGKKTKSGKELIFVGSPRLARHIIGEKERETDFDIYFDETAEMLSKYFDVQRMPLLPTEFRTRPQEQSRHYYLTYNNAILETYREKGKDHSYVYLPTYAQDVPMYLKESYLSVYYGDEKKYRRLDQAAKTIWERAGFTVLQMDGLESLAMSWGAVHCMAKTLARSPFIIKPEKQKKQPS